MLKHKKNIDFKKISQDQQKKTFLINSMVWGGNNNLFLLIIINLASNTVNGPHQGNIGRRRADRKKGRWATCLLITNL
jgi:hypothetical protein